MSTEQAEAEINGASESEQVIDQPSATESTQQILENALKDNSGSPAKDSAETDKIEQTEQVTDKPAETLYGEIVIDEAKKLGFKTEKEFQAWVEKHPFLKDKFLMQSDYTRKTSQVAEERKAFLAEKQKIEEQIQKESAVWGATKPSPEDLSAIGEMWNVFQHGSDQLAERIQSFLNDVSLIAKGKAPTGPLAGQAGAQVDFQRDSTLISTNREISQLKQKLEQEQKEREQRDTQAQYERATQEVNSWISAKKEQGIEITMEDRQEMARFSQLKDAEGNRISFDEMYKLAMAATGKTEKLAVKKVFTNAKEQSKRTPNQPTSRASASVQGTPKDIEGILKQGLESLKT
jgi:hypothetical protein